jgi:Rod binding domain-containing protein
MNIAPTNPSAQSFSPLGGARRSGNDHEKLVAQARSWVAQTFFGTMLKQMRESPFKSDIFSGGRGGQAFGGLYDQHLAERMGRGAGTKLVNALVRKIEGAARYQKSQASSSDVGPRQHMNVDG